MIDPLYALAVEVAHVATGLRAWQPVRPEDVQVRTDRMSAEGVEWAAEIPRWRGAYGAPSPEAALRALLEALRAMHTAEVSIHRT